MPYDVVNRDGGGVAGGRESPQLPARRASRTSTCPPSTDPYDARVYAQGARGAGRLPARRDAAARCRAARCTSTGRRWTGGRQTGVVACVHVDDYEHDIIRKHEKTRKDKEDDRTRHVLTLDAQRGAGVPGLSARAPAIDARRGAGGDAAPPLYDFIAPDGVRHIVWKVADPAALRATHFAAVPLAYVADGHHRSASAWRAGQERRAANPAAHRRRGVQLVPGGAVPVGRAARSCPTTGW